MCTMQQVNLWELWHCWPLRIRDLHHCERHAISCRMAVSDLNLVVIWSLCDLRLRSTGNFGFWFDILPQHWAYCFAARCALRGCRGIRYTVRSALLSFWTPIRLGCLDGNCHCPCTIGCGRQLSWRPGTILGTWCSIGKHFLMALEVFDLYCPCTLLCPSSSMGAESGHCITIGTFGLHSVHL